MFLDDFLNNRIENLQDDVLDELDSYLTKREDVFKHSKKVTYYALKIFDFLQTNENLSNSDKEDLFLASLFHDIGKILVPPEILDKPGKLTDEEFSIMKKHSEWSVEILRKFQYFHHILPYITYHHERYDGTGYPFGLEGEQIPLLSRIMAVADSFDAMTSNRVYSKAHSVDFAFEELKSNKGFQFDSKVVDSFVQLYEQNQIVLGWIF